LIFETRPRCLATPLPRGDPTPLPRDPAASTPLPARPRCLRPRCLRPRCLFDRGMDALRGRASGMTGIVGLVQDNAAAGRARELRVQNRLEGAFPNAKVQRESYLRNADGTRAVDPLSGEARRMDHVVIENERVRHLVETTSPTADKMEQILKEQSIRSQGPVYIRDRSTGKLIEVSDVETRIIRVK
jgi:hypothetical protein